MRPSWRLVQSNRDGRLAAVGPEDLQGLAGIGFRAARPTVPLRTPNRAKFASDCL